MFEKIEINLKNALTLAVGLHVLIIIAALGFSSNFQTNKKNTPHAIKLNLAVAPSIQDTFDSATNVNQNPSQTPTAIESKSKASKISGNLNKTKTISSSSKLTVPEQTYMMRWQEYVENFGNNNYPQNLKNNNLTGSLRLLVAINQDGSLHKVLIRSSSGNKKLDEAAVKLVKKAAPFDPLPESIAANTNILEIIRTWEFNGQNEKLNSVA